MKNGKLIEKLEKEIKETEEAIRVTSGDVRYNFGYNTAARIKIDFLQELIKDIKE